jgi:rubrerythrin
MKLEAAIKSALEFENRIRDLYIEAVTRTDEPAGKKIFQTLADDEQRHVDYLESRLDEWQQRGAIRTEHLESTLPDKRPSARKRLHCNRKSVKIPVA